jgi:hypothetical protein
MSIAGERFALSSFLSRRPVGIVVRRSMKEMSDEELVEVLMLRAEIRSVLEGNDPSDELQRWIRRRNAAREAEPHRSERSSTRRGH